MNKKTIQKASLFFTGLISRMEENKLFFTDITINFKSGTKNFPAKILYGDEIILDYQAVKREVKRDEIWNIIAEELTKYDEAQVIYTERGAKIVIDISDKKVNMRHEDVTAEVNKTSAVQTGREYVVNPALAKDLLTEIGILAKNGKIKNDKIRKYNQIDYFVELMQGVLKEIGERDEYVILDAACGKSYLSFVLNFYMREILKKKCRFIGVDYSETVITASKRIAKNLGYNNMEFIQADLTEYTPSVRPDIVISLHACDTATDMALALGIRADSRAIVSVPCCHKDILKQYSYAPFEAITRHGILKARLADTLTDGIRAAYLESVGYKVSMIEYISPLETPKNIMIRAVYTGRKNEKSAKEYNNLKEILNVNPALERFLRRYGMNFEEKTISGETIYDGKIINVRLEKVELPDGQLADRELVGHPGGVGVIAVDENNEVFIVSQYRIAARSMMLEIPAGKLEYGEDPLECGKRELIEETGYKAKKFVHLGEYYATPGYCEEKLNIYLARDLEFVGQNLDDGEFLNVKKYSLDELYKKVMQNEIYDAKTAIAILKTKEIID